MTGPSDEAVERAARAGYETRIRRQLGIEAGMCTPKLGQRTLTWFELPEYSKEKERAIARAALEASGLAAEVERLTVERDDARDKRAAYLRELTAATDANESMSARIAELERAASGLAEARNALSDVLAFIVDEDNADPGNAGVKAWWHKHAAALADIPRPGDSDRCVSLASGLAEAGRLAGAWQPTHRHYKGGLYRVVGQAMHSERPELLVIYENSDGEWWARPEAMFNGTVHDETVDGKAQQIPRFARIAELSGAKESEP